MSAKDITVKSFDGLIIYGKTWHPPTGVKTKARILFIHGFAEYSGAYDSWFPRVAEAGYEVTLYDQRGFGRTAREIKREGLSNERNMMGDLEAMIDYVSKDYAGKLVLWGFSMGGAICLNYMIIGKKKTLFDLYISTGPEVEVGDLFRGGFTGLKLRALPVLAKVFPNYVEDASLTPQMTNNNPKNWELFPQQKLRSFKTSAEYMNDAINRGKRLLDPTFIANIVDKPLLLSLGTGDIICKPESTKEFFEKVKLTDKTIDLHPGKPHELMQNTEEDQTVYWDTVRNWLDSHIDHETVA